MVYLTSCTFQNGDAMCCFAHCSEWVGVHQKIMGLFWKTYQTWAIPEMVALAQRRPVKRPPWPTSLRPMSIAMDLYRAVLVLDLCYTLCYTLCYSTPLASEVHCSINELESSSSLLYYLHSGIVSKQKLRNLSVNFLVKQWPNWFRIYKKMPRLDQLLRFGY